MALAALLPPLDMIDARTITQHRLIGVIAVLLGLAAIRPGCRNIDPGLIEKVRRRHQIGDMLGPAASLAIVVLGGGLPCRGRECVGKVLAPLRTIVIFSFFILASLLLMRWAGPALVGMAQAAGLLEPEAGYRQLRDTLPWKLTGFLAGGCVMIWTLAGITDGNWTARRLGVSFLIALVIALAFDLPFDDLVLPPNGDL